MLSKTPPNVLFIVIDQFRGDLLHGDLAAHLDLPNLRGFMQEAVSFTDHYTAANPCGPSRASLLTGRYAMNHRSVRNRAPLAAGTPNLASEMRKAGYHPLLFGYTDTTRDPRTHAPRDPLIRTYETEMPDFEVVVEMRMEESRSWQAHLHECGYDLPPLEDLWVPDGPSPNSPALYRAEDSDSAFLTDCFVNGMAVRRDIQWCAHLTYLRPHPPLVAPAPYNTMYDPAAMPAAKGLDSRAEEAALHPFIGPALEHDPVHTMVKGFPDLTDSPETTGLMRALYFALATEVDAQLGRVFQFLRDTGQWDDTVIVISGDHGEMLGDRHCWGKETVYDAAWHVPLLIKAPGGAAGHAVTAPTESVDVLPTLLDLAGLEVPHWCDGRSLAPLVRGETPDDWRRYTFSELDFGNPLGTSHLQSALGLELADSNLAILRDGDLRLVQFASDLPPLLLDRSMGETRNLAADPAYAETLLRMTQAMLRHRMRYADRTLSDWAITPDGPRLGGHAA